MHNSSHNQTDSTDYNVHMSCGRDMPFIPLIFTWFSDENLFTWKVVYSFQYTCMCWPNYSALGTRDFVELFAENGFHSGN